MPEPRPRRGTVIVTGIMVWYPLAGVSYQFLHYLLGLRKLGYDAYYLEDTLTDVYNPAAGEFTSDAAPNIAYAREVLHRHGFEGRWAYHAPDGSWAGMTAGEVSGLLRRADALLNVTGAHQLRDEHLVVPRRLYVESDPFAVQVRVAKGEEGAIRFLDAHTHFFSFGESLGRPDCTVPIVRYQWQPTRQPVFMEAWATDAPGGATYTTVTTWHNKGEGIEWQGERYYWTKDIEFRKFLGLPRRRPLAFEMAASVDDAVRALLHEHGWRNTDAVAVSRTIDAYRAYIQQSRAEFTVARDQYNRPRTGWFSDRSVCYLAAGRPVITQETGFSSHIPAGRGLFAYRTMDDILAAVDAIESDYPGHCRAAREIADAYFSTDAVLPSLMSRAGL
ncbi:MAG: hypothetical protein WD749_14725 [Phycisphaerales bacterium]